MCHSTSQWQHCLHRCFDPSCCKADLRTALTLDTDVALDSTGTLLHLCLTSSVMVGEYIVLHQSFDQCISENLFHKTFIRSYFYFSGYFEELFEAQRRPIFTLKKLSAQERAHFLWWWTYSEQRLCDTLSVVVQKRKRCLLSRSQQKNFIPPLPADDAFLFISLLLSQKLNACPFNPHHCCFFFYHDVSVLMSIINDFKLLQLIQRGTWQMKCDVQFKGELKNFTTSEKKNPNWHQNSSTGCFI